MASARPENEFSALLNSSATAIFGIDCSGCITRWSLGAKALYGYSDEEMLGVHWQALAPPDKHSELNTLFDKLKRKRSTPIYITQRLRKNGEVFDAEFSIFPIRGEGSEDIIGALSITTDITERRESEARLAEFAKQIETILDTVLDGIITVNPSGIIESVNPAAERIFQYRAHEIIGCNVNVLMPEPYHSEHDGYLRNYARTGKAKIIGIGREVKGRRKNGEIFPMSLAVAEQISGDSHAFVGVVADITESKQRELELQQQYKLVQVSNEKLTASIEKLKAMQEQLVQSEKMAALGGLVAGLAHEINTPIGIGVTASSHLSTISESLTTALNENTLRRSELDSSIEEISTTSELIFRNLERAAKLISSFKQVAVDQSNEELREINVGEYLEEILLSLRPELKKYHCTVDISAVEPVLITINPGAFYQIVSNVVINACLHGYQEKGGEIQINVALRNGALKMTIEDHGVGIPADKVGKIFDPFFTTRRTKGGTGLGLNIVYNIVTQAMKGAISVESSPQKGSCFSISIPMPTADQISS